MSDQPFVTFFSHNFYCITVFHGRRHVHTHNNQKSAMEGLEHLESLDEPLPDISSAPHTHEIIADSSQVVSEVAGASTSGGAVSVDGGVPVPLLRGVIVSAESEVNKQKMIWKGEWMMKETDQVRRAAR